MSSSSTSSHPSDEEEAKPSEETTTTTTTVAAATTIPPDSESKKKEEESSSSSEKNENKSSDEDTASDDLIVQFLSFTGSSDTNKAKSYIEMAAHDLQTAVSLYMDNEVGGRNSFGGGGGTSSFHSGMNSPFSSRSNITTPAAAPAPAPPNLDPDGVRAPDQTRTMRLMDFDDHGAHSSSAAIAARMMASSSSASAAHLMGMGMGMGMGGDDDDEDAMMSAFATSASSSSGSLRGGGMDLDARDIVNRAAAMEARMAMKKKKKEAKRKKKKKKGEEKDDDGDGDDDSSDEDSSHNDDNDDDDDDDVEDIEVDDDSDDVQEVDGPNATSSRSNTDSLADLFAAPTHLMHRAGGFQGARNVARDARRWLLVNVQSGSEFACHALNRDVWRDELVENLVREGFIFWQSMNTTPDGQTYVMRYKVQAFPHVAIIDPRTGRLMWKKEGWTQQNPMTPEMFAEIAADFCSRHSFDKPPVAPRQTSTTSNGTSSSSSTRPPKRPITEMTEEQQLQEAIRASMNQDDDDNDDDNHSVQFLEDAEDDDVIMVDSDAEEDNERTKPVDVDTKLEAEEKKGEEKEEVEEEKTPSFEEELVAMEVGDEPSGKENVARVQIRMPDGKRLVRKFRADDSVKIIYAFVAQSNEEAKDGKQFCLNVGFPPRDLFSDIENNIKSAGLSGDSISVRWK